MRSFISNSRYTIITIVVAVISFFAYNAIVTAFPLKYLPMFSNAKLDWVAKYQALASAKSPKIVFAGSSLTNAIPAPYFPTNGYSLGFSGGSSATTVALTNLLETKPDIAIVEVKVLHRGLDQKFIDDRQSFKDRLAIKVPALQPHNRPLSYLTEAVAGEAKARANNFTRFACGRAKDLPEWQKNRLKTVEGWKKGKPDNIMLHNARKLKREIDTLEAAGTKVYLIDYPVHPDLHNTAYAKQTAIAQNEAFPKTEYRWININADDFFWYDGLHFEPASAHKFMKRIAEIIAQDNPDIEPLDFKINCG